MPCISRHARRGKPRNLIPSPGERGPVRVSHTEADIPLFSCIGWHTTEFLTRATSRPIVNLNSEIYPRHMHFVGEDWAQGDRFISFHYSLLPSFVDQLGICFPFCPPSRCHLYSRLCGSARVARDITVVCALLARLGRSTLEGLHEVGDDVVDVLCADRDTNEVLGSLSVREHLNLDLSGVPQSHHC